MRIYDGRPSFYQWDTNQKITSDQFKVGDEIHFFNIKQPNALVVLAYELDNKIVVDVPNILLQKSYPIIAYRVYVDNDGKATIEEHQFEVNQRPKPEDYVYTETEILNYSNLNDRLTTLENNGVSTELVNRLVSEYLSNNPIIESDPTMPDWAKHPDKPSYTADEVGAIAQTELQAAVDTALEQAKASGAFDGADGKSAYQYAVEGGYAGTDTEFKEKLAAEKFASPYALTFAGAVSGSYDGSQPVSVEIPSGGVGSGEGAWTYEKITLEESVNAWTIPIPSAKRVIIISFLRANDTENSLNTGSVSATFKVNNKHAGYPLVYFRNSAKFYNLYDIEKVKAHTKVLYAGPFDNGIAYSLSKQLSVCGWTQTTADATEEITSLQFSLSTGYLFPADCTVEVWYK